jgi:arginase
MRQGLLLTILGHYITEAVAETGCLVALDIMVRWHPNRYAEIRQAHATQEVNPSLLDNASVEMTVAVGCSLARAALGETLL